MISVDKLLSPPVKSPQFIFCFMCGRQHGSKGYLFHQKQCSKKFEKTITIKKINPPQNYINLIKGQMQNIDLKKYNEESRQIYKYQMLSSCEFCGRTFEQQSLQSHLKGCEKKDNKKLKKCVSMADVQFLCPKTLVCCICGRMFGTKSLRIHYHQCGKKFVNEEIRNHVKESNRKKCPSFSEEDLEMINSKSQWDFDEIEDFNKRATQNYRQKAMKQCENCNRKFIYEAYQKHRKNCVLINGQLKASKSSKNIPTIESFKEEIRKPSTIMCFICGRQYGLTSLKIHLKACKNKIENQPKQKSKKKNLEQIENTVLKQQNFNIEEAQSWQKSKIEKYNKVISEIYNKKMLHECYICKRTFFQEALPKHLKNCQSNIKDIRKLDKLRKIKSQKTLHITQNIDDIVDKCNKMCLKEEKNIRSPKILFCYICGRGYGLTSLKIHLPQCIRKFPESYKSKDKKYQELKRFNIQVADTWNELQIEEYNSITLDIYKKKSLHQCKFCQRTFVEQALQKHIKFCEKQSKRNPKKKLMKSKSSYFPVAEQKVEDFSQFQECEISEKIQLSESRVVKAFKKKKSDQLPENEYIQI